jgi:hypothetical protein
LTYPDDFIAPAPSPHLDCGDDDLPENFEYCHHIHIGLILIMMA